jgi:hypothetical protein
VFSHFWAATGTISACTVFSATFFIHIQYVLSLGGFHRTILQTQLQIGLKILFLFYSAVKKNEMLSFTGKWMELENIILSEVSQVQKVKVHMFSFICTDPMQIQAVL